MRHRGTEKTHGPDGSRTMSELDRRHEAAHGAAVITVRCAHCTTFEYEGPADQATSEFQAHLAAEHPDVKPKRRRGKKREIADAMDVVKQRKESRQQR